MFGWCKDYYHNGGNQLGVYALSPLLELLAYYHCTQYRGAAITYSPQRIITDDVPILSAASDYQIGVGGLSLPSPDRRQCSHCAPFVELRVSKAPPLRTDRPSASYGVPRYLVALALALLFPVAHRGGSTRSPTPASFFPLSAKGAAQLCRMASISVSCAAFRSRLRSLSVSVARPVRTI